MNKYEKLKYICDTIWHEATFVVYNWEITNEKDVIFTQEFVKYFIKYYLPEWYSKNQLKDLFINIMLNLNNITDYLFNLMWWKQTQ
jgi:hypothetical protein